MFYINRAKRTQGVTLHPQNQKQGHQALKRFSATVVEPLQVTPQEAAILRRGTSWTAPTDSMMLVQI